jgi:hypothetical protein
MALRVALGSRELSQPLQQLARFGLAIGFYGQPQHGFGPGET